MMPFAVGIVAGLLVGGVLAIGNVLLHVQTTGLPSRFSWRLVFVISTLVALGAAEAALRLSSTP